MNGRLAGHRFARIVALAACLAPVSASATPAAQATSDPPSEAVADADSDLLADAIKAQLLAVEQSAERDALDKAAIRDGEGSAYLLLEGKDAVDKDAGYNHCFERPITDSFETAAGPIDGFVQYVRVSNARFTGYVQAIVSVPSSAATVCFASRITLADNTLSVRPVYSDVASFWTIGSGPRLVVANEKALNDVQDAVAVPTDRALGGFLGGIVGRNLIGGLAGLLMTPTMKRKSRLVQPEPVAFTTFSEIVREFSPKPGLTMIGVIFGKASERWVGLRIASVPAGATLEADGKKKQFMTDGITWIAGSRLERARLRYQRSQLPLSQCAVRPASGRVAANLTCTIR